MYKGDKLETYWKKRIKLFPKKPCHYHKFWQDLYAWVTRTLALRAVKEYGWLTEPLIDIGCGDGKYTRWLRKLTKFDGVEGWDYDFMIKLARENWEHDNWCPWFWEGLAGDETTQARITGDWKKTIIMLTSYQFLHPASRTRFLEDLSKMPSGSRVIILDYMPIVVPEYQKGHVYKEIESYYEIVGKFKEAGFMMASMMIVNRADNKWFFKFGSNPFSFALTLIHELILIIRRKNVWTNGLIIFEKK